MPDSWDYSQKRSTPPTKGADTPLVTYLLCGLCALLTLAYFTSGTTPGSFWFTLGHFGIPSAADIWNGKYWLLLTPFFYHGDLLHIVFNLAWLWPLGAILEATLPAYSYAGFLVAAAAIGSCTELAVSGQTGIGASGVVYAMFGLMWAGRGQYPAWAAIATKKNMQYFVVWGLFCIITTATGVMNVANGAHFGGLLFGLSIGWLFYAPRRRPLWAIPLALLCVLSVLSVTYMPWSGPWCFWKGTQEFDKKEYRSSVAWFQQSVDRGFEPETNWHNISAAWHNLALVENEHFNTLGAQEAERQEQSATEKEQAATQNHKPAIKGDGSDQQDGSTHL